MVEAHSDELGIFGKVEPLFEVAEGEPLPEKLDQFFNNKMPELLADKSVLEQIDKEIQETTGSEANRVSKAKNLKSRIDD